MNDVNDQETRDQDLEEASQDEPLDIAGVIGVLVGAAAIVVTLMGFVIPLIPWILAGVLGIVTLICGILAQPPLRLWIIIAGVVALIPSIILVIVQSMPTFQ